MTETRRPFSLLAAEHSAAKGGQSWSASSPRLGLLLTISKGQVMVKHVLPAIPFVEANRVGGSQKPTAIVLKISSTTSVKGAALGVAQYHHQPRGPMVSFHYIVDNETTYQCVPIQTASYANPHHAISVLICAEPHEDEAMWEDATAKPVLHRAAMLVADLMLTYKIRPRYLRDEVEDKWVKYKWRRRGGLLVRVPGAWPYESFLADVRSQMVLKEKL